MTPPTNPTADTIDLEARARGLAVVMGGAVVTLSALAWGTPGLVAAGVGTALSVANVFLLTRFARQAMELAAAGGPNTAIVRLTSTLGIKTIVLLTLVWVITKSTSLRILTLPLALGLLVTVFCLLGAGLLTALRPEKRSNGV
ncbi:MAG: hypothetical protein JWM82_1400 [Myxococcales bacterium]|nr:hypothetical protein [Myxococcales bacterium]